MTSGLRGYSLPLSPTGESAMLTPPPWHFSGDVVMVEYRVDPAAAVRFLPTGVDPGVDPGAAAAVFANWQWCSDSGAELADPSLCQFNEFLILLACEHDGRPMARCPYAWVDQAVPLVRGWVQGMPKQFGTVHLTWPRTVGKAGPRPGGLGRYDGVLSVGGRRVVEASVQLTGRAEEPPALHNVPLVHSRLFPEWAGNGAAHAPLVASEVTDVEFCGIRTGSAKLRIFDVLGPDLAELAPVAIGEGFVFSYGETLRGGRPLEPRHAM